MQAMVDGALAFFRDGAITETSTRFDLPLMLMTIVNDYADHQIELRSRRAPVRGPQRQSASNDQSVPAPGGHVSPAILVAEDQRDSVQPNFVPFEPRITNNSWPTLGYSIGHEYNSIRGRK